MEGRPNETCRDPWREDLMRRVGDPWREPNETCRRYMEGRPSETCRDPWREDQMRRVGDPWREDLMRRVGIHGGKT